MLKTFQGFVEVVARRLSPWVAGFILLPRIGFAQGQQRPPTNLNINSLVFGMCQIAYWLYTLALIISVIMVLIAAYKYLTGAGDPGRINEAHQTLIYAAVGIIVALFSASFPIIVISSLNLGFVQAC